MYVLVVDISGGDVVATSVVAKSAPSASCDKESNSALKSGNANALYYKQR